MITLLLRILGLAPTPPRTGSREAAWGLVAIVVGLTALVVWRGPEMMAASLGLLVAIWPASIGAVIYIYKLTGERMHKKDPPP